MKLTNIMITKAKLLYLSGKTLKETANEIGQKSGIKLSPEALRKRFVKLKIPLRSYNEAQKLSKRKHIPIGELTDLYTKQKLSLKKLSKKYNSSKATLHKVLREKGIIIRSHDEAVRLTNLKHKRKAFDGNNEKRYYLTGFVEGDVTAFRRSKNTIRAITNTTHNTFIQLFETLFKKYGKVRTYPMKNKTFKNYMWCVSIDLDNSFSFLLLENRKKAIRSLKKSDPKTFFAFLAGFIDAEGSLLIKKIRDNIQYCLRIGNEDETLLKLIKLKLLDMNFNPLLYKMSSKGDSRISNKVVISYNNDYFSLELFRKSDVSSLLNMLPLRHPEKIIKKKLIMKTIDRNFTRWSQIKPLIDQVKKDIDDSTKISIARAKSMYEDEAAPFTFPKGFN